MSALCENQYCYTRFFSFKTNWTWSLTVTRFIHSHKWHQLPTKCKCQLQKEVHVSCFFKIHVFVSFQLLTFENKVKKKQKKIEEYFLQRSLSWQKKNTCQIDVYMFILSLSNQSAPCHTTPSQETMVTSKDQRLIPNNTSLKTIKW